MQHNGWAYCFDWNGHCQAAAFVRTVSKASARMGHYQKPITVTTYYGQLLNVIVLLKSHGSPYQHNALNLQGWQLQ